MKNLVQQLNTELSEFKKQYLVLTENFLLTDWVRMQKIIDDYYSNWTNETSKIYHALPSSVKRNEQVKFIENQMAKADKSFDDNVLKLAARLIKKGINPENINIKATVAMPNIECVINDGNKYLTAYTIIAGGNIQRPHYRYLIK